MRDQAVAWSRGPTDRLLGTDTGVAEPVARVLAGQHGPLSDAFAVQFVHRLHGDGAGVAEALTWLDAGLADRGTTSQAATLIEQERQIGATVTVRNIITSMRVISEIDWSELFERMSPVDDLLGVNETYRAMDSKSSKEIFFNPEAAGKPFTIPTRIKCES